jgi:hypothetical protein
MTKGMMFDVFTRGKEVFDADTEELLGRAENHVAIIEVQRVAHTMSFAKVVRGDLSRISKGLICRAREVKKDYEVGKKPSITKTEKGGIKLPFDK